MSGEDLDLLDVILGRETNGDHLALLGEQTWTYGALLAATEQLAQVLLTLGAGAGTLLGLCLPQSREYIVAFLAIYRIGGISVLINPTATLDEKHSLQQHSGMRFLITQKQERFEETQEAIPEHTWANLLLLGPFPGTSQEGEPGDCLLIYTSGSTGTPKGVMLTKHSLSHNVQAVANVLGLSSADRTIIFTPPAYAYAVSQWLSHLWVGAAVLPFSAGLFYPARLLQAIAEYHITGVAANPTTFRILTAAQRDHVPPMDQVRYVMTGGQPLEQGVVQQIARYFPHARLGNMYGCTENSPRICFSWLPPDAPPRQTPWPVGYAIAGTDLKVVDTTGHRVSPGQVGEILITGTSLMRCYWREPHLTARCLVDGWFQTGDLGFLAEDGALSLVGRRDNLINVGHEKVAPEEVEIVIACVPGVVEVGVAPGKDALLGFVAVALVVIEAGHENVLQDIWATCHRTLSWAKRPRSILVVEHLPHTLYGKLDRRRLTAQLQHLLAAE